VTATYAVVSRLADLKLRVLTPERQSAQMSKITNDDLTRSVTGCFIAVSIWQQWASKGFKRHTIFIALSHAKPRKSRTTSVLEFYLSLGLVYSFFFWLRVL